nr:hypothetical protein [uncultured Carboxylicivirga sp.]
MGDISDGKTTTEVKHSVDPSKELYDTHIDFWKTLNNLIEGYDEFRFYDSYFLHTTAKIKKDSIFDGWQSLNSQDRKNKILSISPPKTISDYYNKAKACKAHVLKDILDKFIIQADQPSAKEFYKEKLLKHPSIIKAIRETYREEFIISLFGIISFYLIDNNGEFWEIDIEAFDNSFQSYLKRYLIEDLAFPISSIANNKDLPENYRFVDELKSIGYESKIGIAVKDYLQASESQIKMLNERPSLRDELDSFDEDVFDEMVDNKLSHQDNLKYLESPDLKQYSKRFFDDCMDKIKVKNSILGVKGVKTYYPKGRAHNQVDENNYFNWKLDQNNES